MEIKCQFCKSKEIKKIPGSINEYYCSDCGYAFNLEDVNSKRKLTRITKNEFFSIIFNAYSEVVKEKKLNVDFKKKIESLFPSFKNFYKEIAEAYVNVIY
ncbi:MAG: hypothetical protein K2I77_03775, partial [Anaeroplasmataceae bacterium]|nr:hypothetical protein [Anaeroplasmataceae bacterium]